MVTHQGPIRRIIPLVQEGGTCWQLFLQLCHMLCIVPPLKIRRGGVHHISKPTFFSCSLAMQTQTHGVKGYDGGGGGGVEQERAR